MTRMLVALAASALTVFCSTPLAAQQPKDSFLAKVARDPGGHFVSPKTFDVASVLPQPPAAGSVGDRADLEAVLQVQAWRSPEQEAWAKYTDKGSAFHYAAVLGDWFTEAKLPAFRMFFDQVAADTYAVCEVAKKLHMRPRPFQADARVKPCVFKPSNTSYPSGHSTQAFVNALVLAEIFPDLREDLVNYAHKAAWGRIIGGVHFPSDDVGGRILAEAMVAEMKNNPAFLEELEKCRREAAPFRMKKAG